MSNLVLGRAHRISIQHRESGLPVTLPFSESFLSFKYFPSRNNPCEAIAAAELVHWFIGIE